VSVSAPQKTKQDQSVVIMPYELTLDKYEKPVQAGFF
jgi:hypothetical protein